MKVKKLGILVVTILLLVSFTTTSLASDGEQTFKEPNKKLPQTNKENQGEIELIETITSKNEINNIIITDDVKVPDGMKLVEVKTFRYTDPEVLNSKIINTANPLSIVTIWHIYNINYIGDFYYGDSPDYSDWYDGPATITETYTTSRTASFTASTGVTAGAVSANIGFTIGQSYQVSKQFSTTIAKNEQLNVKVFTNYYVKQFDVEKSVDLGPFVYLGKDKAWKPIGLIFKQYRFSTV
jgi:hypothetical protein